jgi:hypothetical protein
LTFFAQKKKKRNNRGNIFFFFFDFFLYTSAAATTALHCECKFLTGTLNCSHKAPLKCDSILMIRCTVKWRFEERQSAAKMRDGSKRRRFEVAKRGRFERRKTCGPGSGSGWLAIYRR